MRDKWRYRSRDLDVVAAWSQLSSSSVDQTRNEIDTNVSRKSKRVDYELVGMDSLDAMSLVESLKISASARWSLYVLLAKLYLALGRKNNKLDEINSSVIVLDQSCIKRLFESIDFSSIKLTGPKYSFNVSLVDLTQNDKIIRAW